MREMSKKNKYYLPKERKKELEYFCRQYPFWKAEADKYLGAATISQNDKVKKSDIFDPVATTAEIRESYLYRMSLINKCLNSVTKIIFITESEPYDVNIVRSALFLNITNGETYESLCSKYERLSFICSRNLFYKIKDYFFYKLDKLRW